MNNDDIRRSLGYRLVTCRHTLELNERARASYTDAEALVLPCLGWLKVFEGEDRAVNAEIGFLESMIAAL